MVQKSVWQKCERCGADVFKRKRPDRETLCRDCAELAVRRAAEEMVNRRGPAFDAWRRAVLRVAQEVGRKAS